MGEIHVIADGALLITDGVIQHVGTSRRLERLAEARKADELDVSGRVVTPGFVDCFTQLLCGPPRPSSDTGGEDPFAGSSRAYRAWSSQRLELEGRKRLRQFVRFGSTTIAGSCGYALNEETELRSLRTLGRLGAAPLELAPFLYTTARAWRRNDAVDPWEILERLGTALLPAACGKHLLSGVAIGDGFPGDAVEGYLACAARLGLPALVETKGEGVDLACRGPGVAAVVGLENAGVLHARQLSAANRAAVLLPWRAFHGGRTPYAPARTLIEHGVIVALATGFDNLTSPTMSLPMVMALACTQMRMTPEEALTAATVNAAHALGLGSRLGTLEYGRSADLLVMDCGDYREIPLYFGMNPVTMVMRRGETIFPRVEVIDGH